MKKAIKIALIIFLVASMLFALTGCGKEKENKVEFSMGEWKDNVYENEFLGLEFNLPEGWEYSSDEEIAKTMNLGTELLNDDQKYAAEVSKLNSVYYMLAKNPSTGDNVTVLSEKPLVDVTTEYYLDQLETQLTAVDSINYEIGDASKEKVAGREYSTLTVKAKMSGIELTQKYFVYKMDEYFIGIIATSANGETGINDMMKSFK